MKNFRFVRWVGLASIAWLINSCSTTGPDEGAAKEFPRFHRDAPIDMVLRFYRWDSIYMTTPDTRKDGFLPLYARDDIGREVKSRNIGHNLAVVVVSSFYREPVQLTQLSQQWTTYLNEQGFRRVVVLLAGRGKDLEGLPVLMDSTIAGAHVAGIHDEQPSVNAAHAIVPPAAGADVAHPSSPPVR